MCGPDSRVSRPISTRGLPPRDCVRGGAIRIQVLTERQAHAVERRVIERIFTRHAANPVRSEELFGHELLRFRAEKIRQAILSSSRDSTAPARTECATIALVPLAQYTRGHSVIREAAAVLSYRHATRRYQGRFRQFRQRKNHRGRNRDRILLLGVFGIGHAAGGRALAYFLDPVVNWMEEWHIPRALGSLIVVLLTIAAVLVLAWSLIERVDQFGRDWPNLPQAAPRRRQFRRRENGNV